MTMMGEYYINQNSKVPEALPLPWETSSRDSETPSWFPHQYSGSQKDTGFTHLINFLQGQANGAWYGMMNQGTAFRAAM